ncbi:MAG: cyclic pyranopterin monophosphate synthase MoaC [Victivallales bacterium]|nr:cyclic pyranopterin monophosphate synthase MoaC [Victivallales bacterium]MCF7889402.1 cyclic pyranopterin monophosphate synthase MoaC [Victivallales bacterium]
MNNLSHIDKSDRPAMVDVSRKKEVLRKASAEGVIYLQQDTLKLIQKNKIRKGNVLVTAELAGVSGAKKTSELIPLCHNIFISKIDVKAEIVDSGVKVTGEAVCTGKTGIEMEALTAVNIALLTIYDMCKAVDKKMKMTEISLISKTKEELK